MTIYHLCILDDDPAAVITPILDRNIPSDGIILSYPHQRSELAKRIQTLVKAHGTDCQMTAYPESGSVEKLKLHYANMYDKWLRDESQTQLWLNASTGARRPLLSAQEVARIYKQKTFLVDPQSDQFVWLYPDSEHPIQVADKIKLRSFFQLYGAELVASSNKSGIANEVRQLGENWAMQVESYAKALGTLNYLARGAGFAANLTTNPLTTDQQNDTALLRIIDDLQATSMVEYQDARIKFVNEQARFFANGGWLEELTFSIVRGLRSEVHTIQDDGHSVEIQRTLSTDKPVKNELDVALLANNKLHVIECKTMRFKGEKASTTLYKLDTLSDVLGGMSARGMLVSYLPISESDMQRAKDLRIEVVSFRSLKNLKQRLRQWISEA